MSDLLPTLRGTKAPVAHREIVESSPTQGYTVRKSFAGFDYAQMAALFYDYVRNGCSGQHLLENGVSRLEIEDATQNIALDVWQIVGNEETRDIFEHPNISFLSVDLMRLIRADLEQLTDESLKAVNDSSDFKALSGDQVATLNRFTLLYLSGTTNFRRQQYVLRHTTNAPQGWANNIADVGVDQIYTTAQLIAEISDASLWVLPAPNRILGKINAIPVPDARTNYLWGWLKSASTETTAANNRIEINQEYILELWSTDLYKVYTP